MIGAWAEFWRPDWMELFGERMMLIDQWPACPECDAPRSTKCLICGTTGHAFAVADMGFEWVPSPEGPESGCGSGNCGCDKSETGDEESDEIDESGEPITLVMCPTCDEPFTPEYVRRCESCGHEFPDGYDPPETPAEAEDLSGQAVAVIVGLIVLSAGLIGYFVWVTNSP